MGHNILITLKGANHQNSNKTDDHIEGNGAMTYHLHKLGDLPNSTITDRQMLTMANTFVAGMAQSNNLCNGDRRFY